MPVKLCMSHNKQACWLVHMWNAYLYTFYGNHFVLGNWVNVVKDGAAQPLYIFIVSANFSNSFFCLSFSKRSLCVFSESSSTLR